MFQTTSQRHTSHTFIVCHQKNVALHRVNLFSPWDFGPVRGFSKPRPSQGHEWGTHPLSYWHPQSFLWKKKRFSHMFWNKNAVPMVFPRVFFHPPRCLFHVGLVVVLQGLSQHLQRGPHGFGGRLQGAHVLRTQRCGNGEQTDSMVITMV